MLALWVLGSVHCKAVHGFKGIRRRGFCGREKRNKTQEDARECKIDKDSGDVGWVHKADSRFWGARDWDSSTMRFTGIRLRDPRTAVLGMSQSLSISHKG